MSGDPEVSQDDLWRELGRDVQISYDDMNRVINKEERQEGEGRGERVGGRKRVYGREGEEGREGEQRGGKGREGIG